MKDQLLDTDIVGEILELVGIGLEVLGALVIVFGIVLATFRYLTKHYNKPGRRPYFRYKIDIGLSLLLGLEILVAADIIETIAFDLTFQSVGVLAVLIIIRTLLSWVLVLEVEGRWPWQPELKAIEETRVTDED